MREQGWGRVLSDWLAGTDNEGAHGGLGRGAWVASQCLRKKREGKRRGEKAFLVASLPLSCAPSPLPPC